MGSTAKRSAKRTSSKPSKAPRKKGSPGAPPKFLQPAIASKIVDFIRAGNFPDVAASAAGIHKATFNVWLKNGAELRRLVEEQGYSPRGYENDLVSFHVEVEKAISESEVVDVLTIGRAASKDWKAAAFRLDRRHRSRWARENASEGRHAFDGGPAAPTSDDVSDDAVLEELALALDSIREKRKGSP